MTPSDLVAIVAGIASIAWINWYFFGARGAASIAASSQAGGTAEVVITVDGGYSPAHVTATAGRPVRLVFDRRDTSGCTEEVVFPDFGIRRFLPTGQRTVIEITPPHPGRYEFMCGMSMLRGSVTAE